MAAAILRTRSSLLSSAPPPSPIATAKGLRSAAINDPILSEFLDKSRKIPDLTLPESYFGRTARRIPAEIDLTSLTKGDEDSVNHLLESAAGLGVFQIVGHKIPVVQIGDVIQSSDQVFRGVPRWRKLEMNRYFGRRNEFREDLFWFGEGKAMEERLAEDIGAETVKMVRENTVKLFAELEAVADTVGRVLSKHARNKQRMKRNREQESVLCIHKYSSNDIQDGNLLLDGQIESDEDSSHAFLFHLSDRDLEFRVRSKKGSFSFSASAGAIVVTIGERLEEWSHGEFKISTVEPIFDFGIDADPCFTLQFKSSPSSLNYGFNRTAKILSLVDQMLIMLTVAILYNLFKFVCTKLA